MRYLLILGLVFASAVSAATYKWVDKDGNVHYSDTPVEGAERVDLPEPMVFSAPEASDGRRTKTEEPAEEDAAGYTEFRFISPVQEQVFWAAGGEISVQMAVQPALRPGHEIRLYLDGTLSANPDGLAATLAGVWRGAHTLRAVIVDASGATVATAGPVTFHVKQHSIKNPKP